MTGDTIMQFNALKFFIYKVFHISNNMMSRKGDGSAVTTQCGNWPVKGKMCCVAYRVQVGSNRTDKLSVCVQK